MIDWVLRQSLRHRIAVLVAAAALVAVGGWRLTEVPVDVFPDLSAPRVTIVTEATGLAPLEVEQLITFPLETAVHGVSGTRRVRSASAAGISIVWVEFDWSVDPIVARQRVAERLQAVATSLPPEAEPPILAPPSSVMGEIAFVALTAPSESVDPMQLRRVAERDVRRRLLAVPGVAQVVAIGGEERQYQILVDPERLARFELGAEQVVEAIGRGSRNEPGGYLIEDGREAVIRLVGRAGTTEALGAIRVTTRDGVPVRVRDVADVQVGPAVRRGAGSYDATPAVVLSIVKQPGADTLETTARVDAVLDELGPAVDDAGITLHRELFRQETFVRASVDNLLEVLRDGAILVALVLILFLWHPGATVTSVLAIPLSLLTATLVLDWLGYGLDTMTLGGLAIAIGELVDDAIVDVENVTRRLRERAKLPAHQREPVLRTVLSASSEIRSSIVSATAILMLVFVPLLFLSGMEGRLLRPLAVAYLVAIGASLVVAVTVTPVLASYLLPRGKLMDKESPLVRRLEAAFAPVLEWTMKRPQAVLMLSVAALAFGVLGVATAGRSFLPAFNEGSLNVAMVLPPGTSLETSDQLGRFAEEVLLEDPAVVSTTRRTGRAERDEHVQGPEASEMDVLLDRSDEREREELLSDLRDRLAAIPGASFTFGQPISHRIDHMLSGQRAALTVRAVGDDLDALRQTAERVGAVMEQIDGLVDVQVEPIVDTPQVLVRVNEAAAARYGLAPGEVASAASLALWGKSAGSVLEDGMQTDVVVRQAGDARHDMAALEALRVRTPAGASVPLASLAEVRRDAAPNYVMREDVRRRVVVTANISGRDLRDAVDSLRERVDAEVERPAGITIEYAGQFEQEEQATRTLLFLALLVVFGIALIVGGTLRSARRAAIVLVNLPLALVGGVVGVYLVGGVMSIATTIGFITLFGIATRNGILLATRAADLEREGVDTEEAIRRGATERLAPILMTAITAALGLLPLALAQGEPGAEIQAPMAMVILCGLVTSTALNMLVVPALLARWGGAPPSDATAS
jgi:CzcA family heavy metal efflux pump